MLRARLREIGALHRARWRSNSVGLTRYIVRAPPTRNLTTCRPLQLENITSSATTMAGVTQEVIMGRGILLWLLGVPIPIILLLAMCSHH